MTKIKILFLFFINSLFSFGQNNGYLGKKNFVSIEAQVFTPVIYGLLTFSEGAYKTEKKSYTEKKNWVDYGVNFSIGRALSRNVGFILQFGLLRYDFAYGKKIGVVQNTENPFDYNLANFNKANMFRGRSTTLMPIFEFTNNSGLLPLGIAHQIGFGFTQHNFVEDFYSVQFLESTGIKNYTTKQLYNFNEESVGSFTLMYKLNLRIPLTKRLLYNIGARYNLTFMPDLAFWTNNYAPNPLNNEYMISQNQYRNMVRRKVRNNIVSLETGLSFCF